MKKLIEKFTKTVPTWCMIAYLIALASVGVTLLTAKVPTIADFINDNISSVIRMITAYATSWIPFSLAEYIVFASPVLITVFAVVMIKYAEKTSYGRAVSVLVAVIVLIYSLFTFSFGIGYRTTTLDERLGLDEHAVTPEALYDTAVTVAEKINELDEEITIKKNIGSVNPHTHAETVALCSDSYDKLHGEYGFIKSFRVPVKTMISSPYLTYTFLSGEYTFFTGEANINNNYPDYVNVFTTAHEMAHQRGIAREDEANFAAFLVCIGSDDPFVQYAGYLSMYEYLTDALYEQSPVLYGKVASKLCSRAKYDLRCAYDFLEKYSGSVAADISDTVNDAYLTVQGTEGVKSYGLVVDLAVAYYMNEE